MKVKCGSDSILKMKVSAECGNHDKDGENPGFLDIKINLELQ